MLGEWGGNVADEAECSLHGLPASRTDVEDGYESSEAETESDDILKINILQFQEIITQ